MAEYSSSLCIQQLFEAQVRRRAQSVAAVCEGQHLTYQALNSRANQLAHYLKNRGIGPEVLVGIYVHRSLDMVVGLLAILKAGGAYVPLDPAFPKERLAFMLRDSQAAVLLTQRQLVPDLPQTATQVIRLDSDWEDIGRESEENPACETVPGNLAYVIYTSGSTGQPKGVEITHGAVVNFLHSMQRRPGLTEKDVILAITTLSFDIAVLELFLPLVVGAHLVVLSREVASDGTQLAAQLAGSGITVLQATPATWRLLLHAGWQGDQQLKLLCGGEALPRQLANQLLATGNPLWNMYGPTETTIWSTLQQVDSGEGPIAIGSPIANTQVYLLGADLKPVPAGMPGELHIGGAGLARGYRNRPELSAEKFLPDPFSSDSGSRLYKTGDLARQLPDGTIACLGRLDSQVKIRGYRIELGEVEAELGRHPAVRETVVVAQEDVVGDKRLVAYVVPQQTRSPTARELRRFLKERLPEYMLPSAFVTLKALPLTPNGKVNRLALPAPDHQRPDLEREFLPPRDPAELRLARIWEKVLGIQPIGVQDNIFDLGVHSLSVARLFAEIETAFGTRLPPGPLFQAPTIAQFADLLRQKTGCASWTSLVPIQPHGTKPPLYFVHGGAGTILLFHDLARDLGSDQPFYGLQMQGLYGKAPPHTRVQEMAAHYLKEMRTLQPRGPYYLGGYCFGGLVAFEMAQQLRKQEEEVALLVLLNAPSPLYLRRRQNLPLPEETPLGSRTSSRRWQKLRLRGRKNILAYLLKTVGGAIARRMQEVRTGIPFWSRRLRHQFYLSLGLPLPDSLRDTFFLGINRSAELQYLPEVYQGSMILFRAHGLYDDPFLGWDGLAAGGIEAHEISGDHEDQRTLMKEPYIQMVARRLKDKLLRTQRAAAGSLEELAVSNR